jgi:soluble lytic murein transglycosylase
VRAHIEFRSWAASWNPRSEPEDTLDLQRVLHPPLFRAEILAASRDQGFDPLFFQGLVRVESNFDAKVVSSAGARGLGQIMPATGRTVGRWMGLEVSPEQLFDPELNLRLGARYQRSLHQRFKDSPFLAAAGYNAGEGRVASWLDQRGDWPPDEFVEAIPYEETRLYVWRVLGSWQAYRWIEGSGFVDLARFNAKARP